MFSKLLYQELEDYKLNSLCKEGSDGAIFQAIHRKNQNLCAIKVLDLQRLSLFEQEKGIEDFLSYLKILEKLKHPGIVTILNSGRYQQFIWIAEEWMEGTTLRNFLEKNGTVELPVALKWMESCLNALDYLYQKEVSHNNLKPENIWIQEGIEQVRLSDMALGTDIVNIEKCNEGNLKPLDAHYLAPEQILKQKSDIRTDIYVLGTIFYEMITGRALYEASFPHFIMQYHVNGIPSSFFQENPEIPEEILLWLVKLLAKSPQERFLNPAEFRPLLKKALFAFGATKEQKTVLPAASPKSSPAQEENKDSSWDIPTLDIPEEIKTVRKTQALAKVKGNRTTRAMSIDFLEQANNEDMEEVEVVRVSKNKKLPFQPAVFDAPAIPQEKENLPVEPTTPIYKPENIIEAPPLPKDFVTEHRHYFSNQETDTGIRLKEAMQQEIAREAKDNIVITERFPGRDISRIDSTQKLIHKKAKKDTKPFRKHKNQISYLFILFMTLLTLAVFFVWYKIETMPVPVNQPKILQRPKVIYMITENLGWFGEKLPKGMVRSEKRGEYIWKKDESIMLYVATGSFWRGDEKGKESEQPVNKVYINGFYIDKYELTNAQYLRFVEETGYNPPVYIAKKEFSELKQPVVGINWYDAQRYAKWAQKRLPTEAEWEKAAKGGLMVPDWQGQDIPVKLIENPLPKRIYPWGNEKPEKKEYRVSNYKAKSDSYIHPAPVNVFSEGASPYGCLNMAGNVWELCQDKFDPEFYKTLIYTDPVGPSTETIRQRVCRGGSWGSDESQITCFNRFSLDANYKGNSVGVRLAKSSDSEEKTKNAAN